MEIASKLLLVYDCEAVWADNVAPNRGTVNYEQHASVRVLHPEEKKSVGVYRTASTYEAR